MNADAYFPPYLYEVVRILYALLNAVNIWQVLAEA